MKIRKGLHRALVALGASCVSLATMSAAQAAITIPMVPVGNVGNAADTTGFGSVSYAYNIGQTDVTATQYTAFLNAVAKTDTYGLYNSNMASGVDAAGISQSGSSGSYTYATTKNGNFPVNYVTWGDAARFANWLTNNQPVGAEGNGTTETGSYTLNGATTDAALIAITRNANADYVIPTENEWYKAAYYNPASSTLSVGGDGFCTGAGSTGSDLTDYWSTSSADSFDQPWFCWELKPSGTLYFPAGQFKYHVNNPQNGDLNGTTLSTSLNTHHGVETAANSLRSYPGQAGY